MIFISLESKKLKWLELKVPPVVVVILFLNLGWWLGNQDVWLSSKSLNLVVPGSALILLGVLTIVAGIIQFRRHATTVDPANPDKASSLVQTGIFAFTRNPMYLGMTLIVASSAVFTASVLALTAVPVFMLYLTVFQIKPEERAVEGVFGEEYVQYKSKVRRWI